MKPGPAKIASRPLESYFAPRVAIPYGNQKETQLVTLNEEQRTVLRMVVNEGKNVFFTGSAVSSSSFRRAPASRRYHL